ncbi:MAG: adenosine kinase, partial [Bacteroidota bacterium]
MKKKYDVCAIGNALVDYEIEVEDSFLTNNRIEKGLMTLVEEEQQASLLQAASGKIKKRQGGGSAANTIFGLSAFGGTGYYTCKVADDQDGALFIQDLKDAQLDSNLLKGALSAGTTGKCLVMITPDAERTMNTFLGITTDFSKAEVDAEAIGNAAYLFMEGFLVSTEKGLESMKKAVEEAKATDTKVALSFSDPSMVKYFGGQMKEIVGLGIDLLFCNVEEAEIFTDSQGLEQVKQALKQHAKKFVVTLGSDGAVGFDGRDFIEIAPKPVMAVDATGAGDMFAGAFLYGITHNMDFYEAGKLASAASSLVVGKFGPRITKN